jgi:tryptophan-rich sensory protein
MIKRIILFLVLNFAALAIGGLFTGDGVPSEWYQNLNKAPWTPPGWVFGMAWTTIMICFAFYMAKVVENQALRKKILILYAVQWILNIAWNPAFFYFHKVSLGLVLILSLTILIAYLLFSLMKGVKLYSLLIAPYFLWLLIASSLNMYILIYN